MSENVAAFFKYFERLTSVAVEIVTSDNYSPVAEINFIVWFGLVWFIHLKGASAKRLRRPKEPKRANT